ncbi:MAG: hypothetical protein V8R80_05180 [Eubacterium sp.]
MSKNQLIILIIFISYLIFNVVIGIIMGRRQTQSSHMSGEKKYFIGGRSMSGLVLAMTTMATYTSVSSFVSAGRCRSDLWLCTGLDRNRTGSCYLPCTGCFGK